MKSPPAARAARQKAEPARAPTRPGPAVLMAPAGDLALARALGNRGYGSYVQRKLTDALEEEEIVQRAENGGKGPSDATVRAAAAEGVSTPSGPLPYLDRIQASFGRHSIGHVKGHVGAQATRASLAMDALAFATRDHVVFAGTPDLHTAAHEAAHVVQQQAGVQLSGGVGRAGDAYERQADAVADAVVAGQSAEGLLEPFSTPDRPAQPRTVQQTGYDLPVQRTIMIGTTTYDDARQLEDELRRTGAVVWDDDYMSILQELHNENAAFETLPALLSKMGEIIVAKRQGNPQEMLTEEYWKKELRESYGQEAYLDTQKPDYWKRYPRNDEPKRRLDDILTSVGPALLEELERAGEASSGRLKLYRTMERDEAQAIMDWYGKKTGTEEVIRSRQSTSKDLKQGKGIGIMPIKGHLGDEEQAASYYERGRNTMLEFTLKPGAHQILFDPRYLALPGSGRVTSLIAEHERQSRRGIFPHSSGAEGNLAGYIGLKPEDRGAFSLTMGRSDPTHLLFQLFVESIREVG